MAELGDKLKSLEDKLDLMKTTIERNDSELKVTRCYSNVMPDEHVAGRRDLNFWSVV